MALATVNISFNTEILKQIDKLAKSEARTRSELIREAARSDSGQKAPIKLLHILH